MIFQEWGKRELRRMIAALAALILLLAVPLGTAAEEGSAAEEPWTYWETGGFDTPEDAILQYLSGLKACDPDRMLGAFAWETLSAHSMRFVRNSPFVSVPVLSDTTVSSRAISSR